MKAHPAVSPKNQKMSTAQLKKALEKIKQTQMEVLNALKNQAQAQPPYLNDRQAKSTNENLQANVPYIKSISQLNLLKMTEVNNMRKQFERQRQRYQEKNNNLQEKIKLLEGELALKNKLEVQWNHQRTILNSKIQELLQSNPSNKIKGSQKIIKSQDSMSKQELTQNIKGRLMLESQIDQLKIKVHQLSQEKEIYKNKYEKTLKQKFDKAKQKQEKSMKMSQQIDRSRIPFQQMLTEVKKLAHNHEKVYQSLKSRARIAITDLDVQEQIQQSLSKLRNLIENGQRSRNQQKQMIEIDDSVIQGGKGFDSQSFRDQVKKLDKELFNSDHLKKEIYDLRTDFLALKEKNSITQFQLQKTIEKLLQAERSLRKYKEKQDHGTINQYESLINQLSNQMKKIRQQKNVLSALVKKISQNTFRSNDNEFTSNLRQELDKIIEVNEQLRTQNQQYRLTIDSNNLSIERMKYQQAKYQANLQKEIRQKHQIIQQINKLEKEISEKEDALQKVQRKIDQLTFHLQNNAKKFESDINIRLNENNFLRHELQKNMKQLRNLREVAYNYQLLTTQNQSLKRKLMQINSTVIHLWEIKEAEYSNLSDILEDIKNR